MKTYHTADSVQDLEELSTLQSSGYNAVPKISIKQNRIHKERDMSRNVLLFGIVALLAFGASLNAQDSFKSIFNGKDLDGWDGRPGFWKVQDGYIRGQTTKDNKAPGNTFLIWRAGKLKDFELKITYRITTGNNSGVQYRSQEVNKWVVSGYQSEVQNQLAKTGFLYHEKGRGWLVDVGDFMEISKDGKKDVVGICADQPAVIKAPYHTDNQWNAYHFIARGNHVIHILNGYQTVELIDNHVDEKNPKSLKVRCMEGVLAVQLHAGGPMTVDYKDIQLKQLTDSFGDAKRLFNGKDTTGWKGTDNWVVKALDDPGATKAKRKTKPSGTLNLLACKGGGKGALTPAADLGANYIVRFQTRAAGSKTTGGDAPIKSVLGWDTIEVTVRAGKASATKNGKATDAKMYTSAGKLALSSAAAAEYRNIVLIPIN
jgi:hypothetical protein